MDLSAACAIPGLVSYSPNQLVEQLKAQPWTELPLLLGKGGDEVLVNLLLDCGVFVPLSTAGGNLTQLGGQCRLLRFQCGF